MKKLIYAIAICLALMSTAGANAQSTSNIEEVASSPHSMDSRLYEMQAAPMGKKWDTAPEMHGPEEY